MKKIILLLILSAGMLFGQAKYYLPRPVTSSSGKPIQNATVAVFLAGTTTDGDTLTWESAGDYYYTGGSTTVPDGIYDVYVNGIRWRSNVYIGNNDAASLTTSWRSDIGDSLGGLYDSESVDETNLIRYPSFEEGVFSSSIDADIEEKKTGVWEFGTTIAGLTRGVYFTANEAYHGEQSVMITNCTSNQNRVIRMFIEIDPVTQYTFSIYHKANVSSLTDAICTLRVNEYDIDEDYVTQTLKVITDSISNTWEQTSHTFTTNASTAYIETQMVFDDYDPSTDTIWVDAASLVTGSTAYTWTHPEERTHINNVYEPLNVGYLKVHGTAIYQHENDSSLAPLAVFRMNDKQIDNNYPYRSMVEFQGPDDGIWDSKVDQDGNMWVAYGKHFVTASQGGVSAGHLGQFGTDWTEMFLGTTSGYTLTSNQDDVYEKGINYMYWNNASRSKGVHFGKIGLGHTAKSRYSGIFGSYTADSSDIMIDECPVVIDTTGLFTQYDKDLSIGSNYSTSSPNPSGTIQFKKDTLMWSYAGDWYYVAGTKIEYLSWSPAEADSLVWWYNSDSIATTGSVVDTIYDKSGNGLDLITSGSPVLLDAQKNAINGIQFDGDDDYAYNIGVIDDMEYDQEFWIIAAYKVELSDSQIIDGVSAANVINYSNYSVSRYSQQIAVDGRVFAGYYKTASPNWSRKIDATNYNRDQWVLTKSHWDTSDLTMTVDEDSALVNVTVTTGSDSMLVFGARTSSYNYNGKFILMDAICVKDSTEAVQAYDYIYNRYYYRFNE